MRKRGRVDANQAEIVNGLRKIGATVISTANIGKGFPDLCVGFRGKNYLIEVKDGEKSPSARKLTKDEEIFFKYWSGQVHIANDICEAIEIIMGK